MSKFSELFEQMYLPLQGLVNEQEDMANETPEAQPEVGVDTETMSELPILSNDEIAQFIAGLKQFYSQENPALTQDQIDQIKNVNPRDSREDSAIKASIDVLMKIFNVGGVQTSPSTIPDSTFE
jgi:hypothetical protein